MISDADITPYFAGARLYGDDFDQSQIDAWFADEAGNDASYEGLVKARREYHYGYHLMNRFYLYQYVRGERVDHVLGLGSAAGDELLPVIDRVRDITVLEPGRGFWREKIGDVPARYAMPDPTGNLPCAEESIDLITCLGVLHHIPNVSHVLGEFARVLRSGGHALVREPIVSMGDWRRPRGGLTAHERGIPLRLFRLAIRNAGLSVRREFLFGFGPVRVAWPRLFGGTYYENRLGLRIDRLLAQLFRWNYRYHARSTWQRLRPTAVAYVLRKP